MTTIDAPAPLVPPEVDLRGLPFMPLYVERLQKSKAWLQCKRRPELAFYLMNLWMRLWHEVPAGSIEDDDDVLADAAMCDPKRWPKIKADVLRGWIKCSDGRLYNKTVAELAMEAWAERVAYRARTEKAREASRQKRDRHNGRTGTETVTAPVTKAATETVTASVTEPVTAVKGQGQGKGRDRDTISDPNGSGGSPPPAVDLKAVVFDGGLRWLAEKTGKSTGSLRGLVGKWVRDHGEGRVIEAFGAAQRAGPIEPISWLEASLKGGPGPRASPRPSITPLGVGG